MCSYSGAWSAKTNDANQWIQAEFESDFRITGLQTQGRNAKDQWVKEYKISYSMNGNDWTVFANHDGTEKVS